MTPKLTRAELEGRRLSAGKEMQGGASQAEIAKQYGVSRTAVSRWDRDLRKGGLQALSRKPTPGRPCKLTWLEMEALKAVWKTGPAAAGFPVSRWTYRRFAAAIKTCLGVNYDPDHIGRMVQRLGLVAEMPVSLRSDSAASLPAREACA